MKGSPKRQEAISPGKRVTVANDIHNELVDFAAVAGVSPSDLAVRLIRRGLDDLWLAKLQGRLNGVHPKAGQGTRVVSSPDSDSLDTIPAGRSSRLHDEIIAVLSEAPGPMGASEIAHRIRQRGQYESRSQRPVSGPMISSRVSNPYYRDLFRRSNRKITLAES